MPREPDTDFVDSQGDSSSFSNLSDADSFGGDDSDTDVVAVRVDQISLSLDQSASQHGPSYNSMLAWNKRSDSADIGDDDEDDDEEAAAAKKQARSREPSGTKEKSRSASAERSLLRRSGSSRSVTRSSSISRTTKSSTKESGDELSSSMHKGVTDRRVKRRDGAGGASELASTVHGTDDIARGPSRRTSRGAPNRAKSGDNAAPTSSRRSSKDELGAATLHGKSSVSRIRSKTTRSSLDEGKSKEKEKSKPDRRSMMKRAMSTTNVKRPEEYGPSGGSSNANSNGLPFESPTPRRGGRRPQRPPRRHLLDLLRENKPVTEKDLADKENRQLLHRLMYEHKLGVSLKDLARKVKKETKNGVVPPPPKPLLYVEA